MEKTAQLFTVKYTVYYLRGSTSMNGMYKNGPANGDKGQRTVSKEVRK